MAAQSVKRRLHNQAPKSEIAEILWSYKKIYLSAAGFTIVINLLGLAPIFYMYQVFDRVILSGNVMTLVMLTAILVFLVAVNAMLDRVREMMVQCLSHKIDEKLSQRLFNVALEQNLKTPGSNASLIFGDLATLRQFVTSNSFFAFFDAPWFPIFLGFIYVFSIWLGLFATVSAVLMVSIAFMNEVASKPLAEASTLGVQSTNMATNALRNAEVMHAMGMTPALRDRWYKFHSRSLKIQAEVGTKSTVLVALTQFLSPVMQSGIVGLTAFLVINGFTTPAAMMAVMLLMGRTMQPLMQVIGSWKQWRGALSAFNRLDALVKDNPDRVKGMALPPPKGVLSTEAITTMAPGGTTALLKGVTFTVNPGEALGVIGPSGAGKSTLARVLVGIWPSMMGCVRLDGVDLFTWHKEELGPYMGYLPQDVQLFAGTVSENIARFAKVDAEKVVEAAQLAGIHQVILNLEKGYDTELGDGGAGLSGGQKQRIGLARAFYGNPSLIVLDEPNANLDEQGEIALAQGIMKLRQMGKTIVIMTHRPSVLQVTSKLLILDGGVVKAYGATKEIMDAMAKASAQAAAPQVRTPAAA